MTVTRVPDGDSLVVTFGDGRRGDVRLQGIDAPEAGQPWGRQAGENLRRLALGQELDLRLGAIDGYGRQVAVVFDEEGDLGLQQIRGGHAWHYARYAREQDATMRETYAAAEVAARRGRLGLWTDPAPVAPWDFKADQRAGVHEAAAVDRQGTIVANRRSRLYHLPGCPGHAAVAPGNAVTFDSEAAARAAGFRRASNC